MDGAIHNNVPLHMHTMCIALQHGTQNVIRSTQRGHLPKVPTERVDTYVNTAYCPGHGPSPLPSEVVDVLDASCVQQHEVVLEGTAMMQGARQLASPAGRRPAVYGCCKVDEADAPASIYASTCVTLAFTQRSLCNPYDIR